MSGKIERKRLAILHTLKEAGQSLPSARIAAELVALGHDFTERTVRFYLHQMDQDGLTEKLGRRGHRITELGLEELGAARVIEKVGFLSARIDQLTYLMSFDLAAGKGTVVINMSVMEPGQVLGQIDRFCRVYSEGFAMGRLLTILMPGEMVGEIVVPQGMIGIGTVCSITLNGVLLQKGIPTVSRFGGLLEIQDKKPKRFVEIITYDGTSLDPLEIFIRSGMTNYVGAIETGNGKIGASFREFPAASRNDVRDLTARLEQIGLGGLVRIGQPGMPLLEIPVNEGRVGAIIIGGLNPVAILEETGVRVHSRALAGLIEFDRLFPYKELKSRLQRL